MRVQACLLISRITDLTLCHKQQAPQMWCLLCAYWCIPRMRYIARRGDVSRKKDQAEQLPQTLPRAANRYGNLLRPTRSPQETAEQCFAFRHRRNIAKRADKNIPWNVRNNSNIFTASGNTPRGSAKNNAMKNTAIIHTLCSREWGRNVPATTE